MGKTDQVLACTKVRPSSKNCSPASAVVILNKHRDSLVDEFSRGRHEVLKIVVFSCSQGRRHVGERPNSAPFCNCINRHDRASAKGVRDVESGLRTLLRLSDLNAPTQLMGQRGEGRHETFVGAHVQAVCPVSSMKQSKSLGFNGGRTHNVQLPGAHWLVRGALPDHGISKEISCHAPSVKFVGNLHRCVIRDRGSTLIRTEFQLVWRLASFSGDRIPYKPPSLPTKMIDFGV